MSTIFAQGGVPVRSHFLGSFEIYFIIDRCLLLPHYNCSEYFFEACFDQAIHMIPPADINVDVDELTDEQRVELNTVGERYGMKPHEYVR